MLRSHSAFGTRKVIAACLEEGVEFSLSVSRDRRITKTIHSINDDACTRCTTPARWLTLTPGR